MRERVMRFRNHLLVACCLLPTLSGICAGAGAALKFNGTSNRVDVAKALVSDDITMSAWVNADTPWVNDPRVIISNSYWGAAANRVGFHLQFQTTGLATSRYQTQADGVGVWSVSGTTTIPGAWHHLTFVKAGTKLSIFVDGKEEGSRNDVPASVAGLAVQDFIRIGCNTSNARFLPGIIDEVCIWNYARTQAQIQDSMGHELRGTEQGLVGYWKFNEGQGTVAADSCPAPHDGTIVGAIWTTEAAPIAAGPAPLAASGAGPGNGAVDVVRDVVLGWKAGGYAATHDVYLGTVLADVTAASRTDPKGVLVSSAQDANTYDPTGVLAFGQTYYWRVDEVNAPPSTTIVKGNVWSFTTETLTARVTAITATASSVEGAAGPDNTVNNSGMTNNLHSSASSAMWLSATGGAQPTWIQYAFDRVYKLAEMQVWNYNVPFEPVLGFGFKDVTIEYSADGTNWTLLRETQFPRAPGQDNHAMDATVDFAGASARFVRLTAKSNWGGLVAQFGLSEVRFYCIPVAPQQPSPASGATGVEVNAKLSWRAGREAASHNVYFGTNQQAVADGTAPVQTAADHSFDPGPLNYGTTYSWKVAEVNEAATPQVWTGDLWSFTTKEFFVVDDFESYTDVSGQEIFSTWIDGVANANSGSIVGYWNAPFAERTVVHGGKQSMPLEYNNVKTPYFSEAEREFSPVQDWTVNGADTLTLSFCGSPLAFLDAAGKITMSGSGTDIWNSADQFRFAGKALTGDGTLVAKVESLGNTDPWAKAGVMIRDSLEPGARFAAVYATIGNGVRYQARLVTSAVATSDTAVITTEQTALKVPVWIKVERKGTTFNCYYSTDGSKWTSMSWNPQTVGMGANVYIGLAVTSHNAAATTTAEFSNISFTGSVSGAWQVQAIGVAQPANDPASFYVAVQDTAGKTKVITYPDPSATTLATWQTWQIPLSEIRVGGVNLAKVKKLMVGVGDKSNPKPGGAGRIFIDDIVVGHPATPNP